MLNNMLKAVHKKQQNKEYNEDRNDWMQNFILVSHVFFLSHTSHLLSLKC